MCSRVIRSVSWYSWVIKGSNQSAFPFLRCPAYHARERAQPLRGAPLRYAPSGAPVPFRVVALRYGEGARCRAPARRVLPPIEQAAQRQQRSETGRGFAPLPARVRAELNQPNQPQPPTSRSFLAITSFLISAVRESNASSSGK
jgi:hypothetical protein